MKKILYLIIFAVIYSFLSAEFTFQYAPQNGTMQDFQTSHICSDYGMRKVPITMTKWHKGVDFSKPVDNTHLLAIDGGTVNEVYVNRVNWKYKTIEINGDEMNYGFGHIFHNGEPTSFGMVLSGMRLKRMNIPYQNYFSIIIDSVAIGRFPDAFVTVGNDTLAVTNIITAGQRIAPLGNSASTNYHVHLYCFKNDFVHTDKSNTQDPLEFIDHLEPSYAITIQENLQDSLVYGESSSHVRVRCEMDGASPNPSNYYTNAAMNLDRVDLLIKPDHSDEYGLIKGPFLYSKIVQGARTNTTIYPNSAYITTTDTISIKLYERYGGYSGSSWNTGINPWAYRDVNGFPYDDFYFCDFLLRIKELDEFGGLKELASCNIEARYPDGKYNLKAKAITVRDSVYWSEPQEILIDNFVPYIKEVKVKSNNSTVYRGGWNWWDDLGLVYADQAISFCRPEVDILIEVTASEPMDTLYISTIEGFDWNSESNESVSEDRTEWIFKIPASQIPEYEKDGDHMITINGTDLSGNSLELMQKVSSPYIQGSIPIRQSAGVWLPDTTACADENHSFSIQSSASGMTYNKIIDGIQTNANFTPSFSENKSYILTDISDLHPHFNLVAWGHSTSIDTCHLQLDQNYIQPYRSNAYKNMILRIGNNTYPIVDCTSRYIHFDGECTLSSSDYRIYDPIEKEILNIGIADTVHNAYENSFIRFSDAYTESGHYLSWFDEPARYSLTMSGETHDVRRHSDTGYNYRRGELFFADQPEWSEGEYILKRKYPTVNNDIVSFDSMIENPGSGWYNSGWCATEGWNNISGSTERGDLDNIVVYNLADHKDYTYNGSNWEQILYPEIKVSPNNLSYFLVPSDIFTDQFTITNDGEGDLDYTVTIAANADTTYIDEGDGTSSDFDVIDIQCGIGSEGFYANMKLNGYSPMGALFIDSDQDVTTGIQWYNDGINSPLGSSRKLDKHKFISNFKKYNEKSIKTQRNASIGIDYVILLDMALNESGEIIVINVTDSTLISYNTIWFSSSCLEFSFPIASLISDNISSDGNCSFFFNFISNEDGQVCEFVPNIGQLSMGESHDWIETADIQGQILAGQSQDINLNIDPTDMTSGIYEANIFVGSNDIIYPWVNIPVKLDLEASNNIIVSKDLMNFGTIYIGQSKTESLFIVNQGSSVISIDNVSTDNVDFVFDIANIVVPAGGSTEVTVTFSPSTVGIISGELRIVANNQIFTVTLFGTGEDFIINPPSNIIVEVENNDVILSWDAPGSRALTSRLRSLKQKIISNGNKESRTFLNYNVYRNGYLIGQTEELTFTDYNVPDSIFTYSVTALYSGNVESEPNIANPVSFAPTITNLLVDQFGQATWDTPELRSEVLSYDTSKRIKNKLSKYNLNKPKINLIKEYSSSQRMGIVGYNAYLDGNLVGFTPEQSYNFDDGFLFYEQQYLAEISVVYDSGESSKESCLFNYNLLNSPYNLSISISNENIFLTWDKVPGITTYSVYSSGFPNSGFIEDTTGTYTQSGWSAPIISSKRFYFVKSVKEE